MAENLSRQFIGASLEKSTKLIQFFSSIQYQAEINHKMVV